MSNAMPFDEGDFPSNSSEKQGIELPKDISKSEKELLSEFNSDIQIISFGQKGNSTINIQTLQKTKLVEFLSNITSARPADLSWEFVKDANDAKDEDSNILQLKENRIIYLSASGAASKWALIYELQRRFKAENSNYQFKELEITTYENDFNLDLKWIYNHLEDLKQTCIIIRLEQYETNKNQRLYLESLFNLREDVIQELKKRGVFIIHLISSALAEQIKDPENTEFRQSYYIWEINSNNSPSPVALFAKNTSLVHHVAYFAGAYFSGLSFRNFDKVVTLLLSGQHAASASEPDDIDLPANGQAMNENIRYWESKKNQVLADCSMHARYQGNMFTVSFAYPDLGEKIRIYLKEKSHYFWQQQCNILTGLRLAFDMSLEEPIVAQVNTLMIEAYQGDPVYHNLGWFREMVYSVKNQEGVAYLPAALNGNGPNGDDFWAYMDSHKILEVFYSRMANLMIRLSDAGPAKKVASGLLNDLINNNKRHEQLLKIIKKLSLVKSFDKFYWLKQLIERGTYQVKTDTYQWFAYIVAKFDPIGTWDAIKKWLPADKKPANFSPANNYASFFMVHYHVIHVGNMPFEQYGKQPGLYPLFELAGNKKTDHLDFVLSQIFKPGVEAQFRYGLNELLMPMSLDLLLADIFPEQDKEKMERELWPVIDKISFNFNRLLADLLETWFNILRGFEKKPPAQAKAAIIKKLLEGIINNTSPEQLDAIVSWWAIKNEIYFKYLAQMESYLSARGLQKDYYYVSYERDEPETGNIETDEDINTEPEEEEQEAGIVTVTKDGRAAEKKAMHKTFPDRLIAFRESLIRRSQNTEYLLQEFKQIKKNKPL